MGIYVYMSKSTELSSCPEICGGSHVTTVRRTVCDPGRSGGRIGSVAHGLRCESERQMVGAGASNDTPGWGVSGRPELKQQSDRPHWVQYPLRVGRADAISREAGQEKNVYAGSAALVVHNPVSGFGNICSVKVRKCIA